MVKTAKEPTKSQEHKAMLLPPPESFFVFVVGHCEEWPENREEQGDTAIYKEYLDFGVPSNQCFYIKDDECTRDNCQESLKEFLGRIATIAPDPNEPQPPPRTLVFYYGGHGCANGFSTMGGTWAHRTVVRTIDECFQGERVLFLVDCCASGNIWQHFPSPSSETNEATAESKEYVLLATSQPYIVSSTEGEEWILSNTWIQIMRHLEEDGSGECCDQHWNLGETISLLADRHAFELGDLFFAYLKPSSRQALHTNWSWMPASNGRHKKSRDEMFQHLQWLQQGRASSYKMPDKAKILSVFDCRVGDAVAYKHSGGCPSSLIESRSTRSSSAISEHRVLPFSVPPLWLNGTIVSIFEDERGRENAETSNHSSYCSNVMLRIRLWYPSQVETWEVEVSHDSPFLISHFHVAQNWMLPRSFLETQVVLAQKYYQYLDCSLAPKTSVRVALGDLEEEPHCALLEGTIMDWKDFDWKHLLRSCTGASPATTEYDEFYWNELPIPIKAAAKTLGYTKSSWDNDTGIPADTASWDSLPRIQKDAAIVLGYIQPKSVAPRLAESNGPNASGSIDGRSFWKNTEISTSSGPHVPLEWKCNHQRSFVPMKQIIFSSAGGNDGSSRVKRGTTPTPAPTPTPTAKSPCIAEIPRGYCEIASLEEQTLVRGVESSGKVIRDANLIFGTTELSAFWVEDEKWYDATPISIVSHDNISCSNSSSSNNKNNGKLQLEALLSTHFEYTLPGVYCPIEYDDGVRQLIPLNYIFRRGCYPQQQEDEVSTSSESDSDSSISSETMHRSCGCWRTRK